MRKQSISADEMYLTMCATHHSGLGLKQIDPLLRSRCTKKIFMFSFSDPDLCPLDVKCARLVTLVHAHVYTKLEVSTGSLFQENRRHAMDGWSDRHMGGMQH